MNCATARIQPDTEQPSARAMRLMKRAEDALDRGNVREASDYCHAANRIFEVMLQFQTASKRGNT